MAIFEKHIKTTLFMIFCILILGLSLRGISGNPSPDTINEPRWTDTGPFELSPERGRFALALSLVEDKSLHFSVPIARFTIPDLGYKNGHYVSLFAPGLSFIIVPGYLLGKAIGLGQVITFAVIALFALLNALLIRTIAIRIGATVWAATIASLIFLFATPAFAYAVSLYQHHVSTFLMLLGIYLVLRRGNLWSLALFWFLFATSVLIDYPNFFLMLPIAIYALGKIICLNRTDKAISINIKLLGFLTFFTVIVPLSFFLWFNKTSYNNQFQISGTVTSVKEIDEYGNPVSPEELSKRVGQRFTLEHMTRKKTITGFFNTRNLLNGFYVYSLSPDRGILWFAPIILLSLFGLRHLYRKNQAILTLLLGVAGVNILLYSMWGDAWGGWAFGSRYLIPSYAILAIIIAFALDRFRKNILFLVCFFLIMSYSLAVNELGALTSSKNPPQVEIQELEKISGRKEKYTYLRNLDFLLNNQSKSFIWQTYGKNFVSAPCYFGIIYIILVLASGSALIVLWRKGARDGKNV